MCEILLKAQDAEHSDPYQDVKCYKAGDVIAVVPNGWAWGNEELNSPQFRIVKFPRIGAAVAAGYLLGSEVDTDPSQPSRMLQRRGWRILRAALPQNVRDYWQDDTRAAKTITLDVTGAQIVNYIERKAARIDPNILG